MVNKTTPIEETAASQRMATEDSNDSAAKATMQVSQDEDSEEDTAEPIISYLEEEDWEKLDGSAQNTRSQHQTKIITQECMLATLEISKATINITKTGCYGEVPIESNFGRSSKCGDGCHGRVRTPTKK